MKPFLILLLFLIGYLQYAQNFDDQGGPRLGRIMEEIKDGNLRKAELIKENLVRSVHDVSAGGLIIALSEMCINSNLGIKIEKPKKLNNLFEYFYGEDQGRYLVEVEKNDLKKVEK